MARTPNEIAAAQHGLITATQARAAGLSSEAISHRVARGDWRRLRRGLYAISGMPMSWEHEVLGALLVAGLHAYASHTTAALLWGFGGFERAPVEITVPLARVMRLDGVRAHRSGTVTDADVREVGGIPTLSAARTIADLSARVDGARLESMVDDGLRRGVVSLPALHAVARRLPTIAPGRSPKRLQRVLSVRTAGYHPGDSELERRVFDVLVAAGLPPPKRQHRVVIDGSVYYIDLAYPDVRVAIEVDGFAFHRDRGAFDRDRSRQNDLVRAGWTVLRFTSESTAHEIVTSVRDLLFVR